jgi:hypothetical protein
MRLTYKEIAHILDSRLIDEALACSDVERSCPDQLTVSKAVVLGINESREHDM